MRQLAASALSAYARAALAAAKVAIGLAAVLNPKPDEFDDLDDELEECFDRDVDHDFDFARDRAWRGL